MPVDVAVLTDAFLARLRAARLTPATTVRLHFHHRAADGTPLPPHVVDVSPREFGGRDAAG